MYNVFKSRIMAGSIFKMILSYSVFGLGIVMMLYSLPSEAVRVYQHRYQTVDIYVQNQTLSVRVDQNGRLSPIPNTPSIHIVRHGRHCKRVKFISFADAEVSLDRPRCNFDQTWNFLPNEFGTEHVRNVCATHGKGVFPVTRRVTVVMSDKEHETVHTFNNIATLTLNVHCPIEIRPSSGATLDPRSHSMEQVAVSPQKFSFRVDRSGRITGTPNRIKLTVKRQVPWQLERRGGCEIGRIGAHTEALEIGSVGISPASCSFPDQVIEGSLFLDRVIRSACIFTTRPGVPPSFKPGRLTFDKWVSIRFWGAGASRGPKFVRNIKVPVTIQCGGHPGIHLSPIPPIGTGIGSGGTGANPMCDLSGSWRQRNTRTKQVSPLIWKISLLKNEGNQKTRNYEVMRFKNGRRFSPPASGRLYQSPKEALLFYDTPASMPRYHVSRIMSLHNLRILPDCNVMHVLKSASSYSGSHSVSPGVVVLERVRQRRGHLGSLPRPVNPVGKPTINGWQSPVQRQWQPTLPDNRRDVIDRKERLRGR